MQAPIHIVDASKIDRNDDSEVIDFIFKYITCALSDDTTYPEMSNLKKKVQSHHHATNFRKEKGVTC